MFAWLTFKGGTFTYVILEKKTFNIALSPDPYEPICFKFGMMLYKTKL